MTDDAQPLPRGAEHPIYAREAQFLLSLMYTFKEVMSLVTLLSSLYFQERRGISFPSLYPATSIGTQLFMKILVIGILVLTITNHSETDGKIDAWKKIIFANALTRAIMFQLEESIHIATNRPLSKTVLNDDMIFVKAGVQTQGTKWSDGDQAFNNKQVVANSTHPKSRNFHSSSARQRAKLWRSTTRSVDQPEPLIYALLLLSDYPTQEGNDLPAMQAWILASTSPPGGVFGRKSARPTAGRRYGRLTSQGTPCGMQGGL
jgi:hypothetical protein